MAAARTSRAKTTPAEAEQPEGAPEKAAGQRLFGKVVNAPTHQNNGGFHENRVTHYANEPGDRTAGSNASMAANAFEQRVTQEIGSH